MGKGSRGYGHSGGHHANYGGHQRHRGYGAGYGGGGGPGQIDLFQINANFQANTQVFSLDNGILFSTGSQMLVNERLDSITSQQAQLVTQMELTVVGQKVKEKNNCCYLSTLIFGALLIIPLIFMCFQWWRNIVHPKYAINTKTYEAIINLVRRCQQVEFVNLNVIDTNLSKDKVQMLASGISQCPQVKYFALINQALDSDLKENQFSNFQANVECFRKLNLKTCQLSWRDKLIFMNANSGVNVTGGGFNEMEVQNIGVNNTLQAQY